MEKWYDKTADNGDIVISTRIRLLRNIRTLPFEARMSSGQKTALNELTVAALQEEDSVNTKWRFLPMQEMTSTERVSLAERNLISRSFLEQPKHKMLALSGDESLSVAVNGEDHIRIQVLGGGMDLPGAYLAAGHIDDVLDERLGYAFDERLGYLTASPADLGTGMCVCVIMHLPALEHSKIIPQLMQTVGRMGLAIRGSFGEGGSALGACYEISNQVTLGLSEETAIKNLENVALQIIESERVLRKEMLKNNIDIIDEICRSYGILKYARLLSAEEFYEQISNVRFGVAEHIISGVTLTSINRLFHMVGAATIRAEENQELSPKERDHHRAKIVREAL